MSALHPINLPKFTLLCGGEKVEELSIALCERNRDLNSVRLRKWTIASGDFGKSLSGPWVIDAITQHEGNEFFINAFIDELNSADSLFLADESFIFIDAMPGDALPLIHNFGEASTLTIMTGPLKEAPRSRQVSWLPQPSLAERMALLTRELGEVK